MTPAKPLPPTVAIPDDFIAGTLMICEKILKQDTGNLTIVSVFNNAHIELQDDGEPKGGIPIPAASMHLRMVAMRPTSIPWTVFLRVLTWNGTPEPATRIAAVFGGTTHLEDGGPLVSDLPMDYRGGFFRITPDRPIPTDGKLCVTARFELWTGDRFLVAQPIDFHYTFVKVQPPTAEGEQHASAPRSSAGAP
jgi:hypothetical protein